MAKTKEQVAAALGAALMDYLDYLDNSRTHTATTTAEPLYSLDELAEMLRKTKSTIRQWACEGQFGETVTVGKSTLITKSGYDQFIAEHTGPTQKRATRKPKKIPSTMTAEQYKALRI